MVDVGVVRRAAGSLENGEWSSRWALGASAIWARRADPVRGVRLPVGARVVGVGGATLGGSCKTPVVGALAREIALRGQRVAVVAHGYRGRARARRVQPDDPVGLVGDDARLLFGVLSPLGVPVLTGKDRETALAMAAAAAPLVIVDGLLQARPRPLDLSLLVLDGAEPWGAARCPPAGDLRAKKSRLMAAADLVLASAPHGRDVPPGALRLESDVAGARDASGRRWSIDDLRARRLGLAVAVARPARIERALERRGIAVVEVSASADHARPRAGRSAVDGWLTTAKCATKLGERLGGRPVLVLEHRLRLPVPVVDRAVQDGPFPVLESAPCTSTA